MATFISWLPNKKLPFLPILFPASNSPVERTSADLKRLVTKTESAHADTLRQVDSDVVRVNLKRQVARQEVIHADTIRKIIATEIFSANTKIQIGITETVHANTFRLVGLTEIIPADLRRTLLEFIHADTGRKIVRMEKAIADTVIRVSHIWNYFVRPNTLRTKKLLANNPASLVDTFKNYGITAVNITLNEKTLSDDFSFDITRPVDINEAVQGTLLDYDFNFLVEETTQRDLVQSVKGMYNQDKLLYTQIFLPTAEIDDKEEVIPIPASQHIRNIVAHLNLSADIKIDNFTPYNLNGNSRITYRDLLNSLFNWTSRVPQRQVNVFIRGGTLHCIQRGKEENVFDISDLPHSRPNVNKKLIRSLWNNPKEENESSNAPNDPNALNIEYLYDEYVNPFAGTISFSDEGVSTTLQYSRGLLVRESNDMKNSKTTVSSSATYKYVEIFPSNMSEISIFIRKALDKNFYGDFYLAKKEVKTNSNVWEDDDNDKHRDADEFKIVRQSVTTTYRYDRTEGDDVYLRGEKEVSETSTYESNEKGIYKLTDASEDIRETFHVPIGNGWYGQSVYLNGEAQGSNISQGKPGNKVSQYTIAEVQKTFKGWTITYDPNDPANPNNPKEITYDDWRRKLSPVMDMSFPVREIGIVDELTSALLWLNRKVQETVTLDLISPVKNGVPDITHIVDFTERVRLDGTEYFLVSNRITFTPRKLIQNLQLIRWYSL